MNTIFADNKIIEQSCNVQQASLRNIPLAPQLQLRMSYSPPKAPNVKKFFFPTRNQSSKATDNSSKIQLENLIKREKLMLLPQKSPLNDIILTPNAFTRQNETVSFPSLEIKNISPVENKSPLRKPRQKQGPFEFKLNDINKEYCSNMLGNFSAIQSDQNPVKWTSQRKIDSPKLTSKTKKINFSIKKASGGESQTRQTRQNNIKNRKPNPDCVSPVSSILGRMKSQALMANAGQNTKRYKKGYLGYQIGGHQYWQKITQGLDRNAKIDGASKVATARIYYVVNMDTIQPIVAHMPEEEIQIASLSKIMTCYLTILISKKYQLDLKQILYRVPDWIVETPGTSAQLEAGDIVSAYDLLFGLMLPSGNDAALCLADVMGKYIQKYRKKEQKKKLVDTFLAHMNMFSKELSLPQQWNNPHGLAANPNYSTAKAITALTLLALQDQTFSQVISTRQYEVTIKNDRYGLATKRVWKNTNKLLEKEGWSGVKTGTTDAAGHCLMALRNPFLIGVFDCQTLSKRFTDAARICDFITSHKKYK